MYTKLLCSPMQELNFIELFDNSLCKKNTSALYEVEKLQYIYIYMFYNIYIYIL